MPHEVTVAKPAPQYLISLLIVTVLGQEPGPTEAVQIFPAR